MKIELKVDGMKCEGCEKRVENALKEEDSVKDVKASFKEQKVEVICDKNANIQIIKNLIEDLGFRVLNE